MAVVKLNKFLVIIGYLTVDDNSDEFSFEVVAENKAIATKIAISFFENEFEKDCWTGVKTEQIEGFVLISAPEQVKKRAPKKVVENDDQIGR